MKKYLMTGIAAVALCAAFTSCSHDLEPMSQADIDQAKYDQAFLKYVGGKIAPDQDWGFSSSNTRTRANNPGEDVYATSGHINANGNEWSATTTGDNPKIFGGWNVPDPLSEGQKLRVKAYFQANPNLKYVDPKWRHFFVQQVYTGGDSPNSDTSSEIVTAADGTTTAKGTDMGALYVGPNVDEDFKINGFTNGTADFYDNVLDNGEDVNTGTHHPDQIMLMVNIDNTETFTYTESVANSTHNNRCALVSAAVIDEWAKNHGNIGKPVVDGWNRQFLGFDLNLHEAEEVYLTENGEVQYATWSQLPEGTLYAWDGEKIIQIADNDQNYQPIFRSGYENMKKGTEAIGWISTNENQYVAADKKHLVGTKSANRVDVSKLNKEDYNNCVLIKDVMDGNEYRQAVLNLPLLQKLIDDGYLPVSGKTTQDWVQVGTGDHYFSDWIVTLTKAETFNIPEPNEYDIMIVAEDLSADEDGDFDFNDVVLKVKFSKTSDEAAQVLLTHAGGTLPLRINEDFENLEVHKLFGVWVGEDDDLTVRQKMVNTGAGPNVEPVDLTEILNINIANAAEANSKLKLEVYKNGSWQEMKSPRGEPACKLAVGTDFKVLGERVSIKKEYENFIKWVELGSNGFTSKWWQQVTTE